MKSKSTDESKIKFYGEAIDISMNLYNASCGSEESEPFLENLYQEYKEAGSPKNLKLWISNRLEGKFQYLDTPPEWVEEEPNWPFHEGRPMVFLTQKRIPKKADKILGWGYVVYLFCAKVETPEHDGWEIVTKTVTQDFEI